MTGALTVLAFCLAGALYGGSQKDGKPRGMGIATVSSIIGAIAVLIAFPEILSIGGETVPFYVPLIAGLVGLLVCTQARKGKNLTGLVLLFGVTLVAWALFRWLPSGPAAFQFLGQHASAAGKEMWTGISGWWKIITSSGPLVEK